MAGGTRRIPALRAAVAVDPDDAGLRSMLADALLEAGMNRDAITEIEVVLKIHPSDASMWLKLAQAYAATGQGEQAESVLARLDQSGEMTPEAWRLRAALVGLTSAVSASEPAPASRQTPVAQTEPAATDPETTSGPEARTAIPMTPSGATPAPAAPIGATPAPLAMIDQASDDRIERPAISFADVGGMDEIKEAIRLKIIYPSQNAELYAAYGKKAGGGLLMYGPPGCGKTHLARATAGEIGASFLSIGIADVLEMWIGSSERNLHAIFTTAREHRPCVLFFDEIDALAADRAGFSSTTGRTVINQFLSELDGATGDNTGLLVLGATNAPWHVDPAFRRPGRFDETLFVPPPDAEARAAILTVHTRDRPVSNLDVAAIASRTDGWSGADLKGLIDRAIERKVTIAIREGKITPIVTGDLLQAMNGVAPTTREWFATVRNYLLYANQSGMYDAVRPYLKK